MPFHIVLCRDSNSRASPRTAFEQPLDFQSQQRFRHRKETHSKFESQLPAGNDLTHCKFATEYPLADDCISFARKTRVVFGCSHFAGNTVPAERFNSNTELCNI